MDSHLSSWKMQPMNAINHIEAQFGAAMAVYGLTPPEIVADGVRHRFDAEDDRKGKKSAWYVLYSGGVPAGAFGNWKTDLSEKWCGKADQTLTPSERAEYRGRIEKAKQAADSTRLQLADDAAKACNMIMAAALQATDGNPYCSRKGIKPYRLKEFKDTRTLIVPIRNSAGDVTSLQFIDANGSKRFKSHGRVEGCYYSFGGKPSDTVLLCEGFADGASLHQATGHPVAVAFNAGNMEAVARVLRAKLPAIRIIVCADNDRFNAQGNIGVIKATAAALAVGGYLAIPVFQAADDKLTDFNDLHQSAGLDAVQALIQAAKLVTAEDGSACLAVPPSGKAESKPEGRAVMTRCGADIVPLPITWLWDGWLPAGKLTILAGTAGTGKTTLALGLAAALTSGGTWPDGSQCRAKGNVLIWSSEDVPDDTLVPRLIASGADLHRCHFIDGISENGESVPFDPAQDILDLHRKAEEIGGVSLLLIDPIVSAVAGDMHRANDVRRSLQAVVAFAEAHRCAVIGITHFAKGGAGKASPQDRVIGSQAFAALARMVLVAANTEDGERRVLARAKSNIAPDSGGIAYRLDVTTIDGGIEATHAVWEGVIEGTAREILGEVEYDENGDGAAGGDLEKLLIDLLTENGGRMPAKQIMAEIRDAGYNTTAAHRAKAKAGIESAKEPGSKTSGWHWYLPGTAQTRIQRNDKNPQETAQNTVDSCVSCPVSCESPFHMHAIARPDAYAGRDETAVIL
jgi:putative DNA primase/helicase